MGTTRTAALGLAVAVLTSCGGGSADRATRDASQRLAINGLVVPAAERTFQPDLQGTTLNGGRQNVTAWRGSVLVVNFWGSWCGPCRKEQPQLNRVARDTAANGVRFLGIDVKDNTGSARAFVRLFHVSYPSLTDQAGSVATAFGSLLPRAVPSTFVLDSSGRVAARFVGPTTYRPLKTTVDQVVHTPKAPSSQTGQSSPHPSPDR